MDGWVKYPAQAVAQVFVVQVFDILQDVFYVSDNRIREDGEKVYIIWEFAWNWITISIFICCHVKSRQRNGSPGWD